jgi:HK97 family phage major capsid protein
VVEVRFDELLRSIDGQLKEIRRPADHDDARDRRHGSRFVGEGAADEVIDGLAVDLGAKAGDLTVSEPHRRQPAPIPAQVPGAEGLLADTLHVAYMRRMGHRPDARAVKALAEGTPSAGGYLVPVEVAQDIMTALRARTVVYALGGRRQQVRREFDMTSVSTGASAAWILENAPIPVSEQTLAEAPLLKPKALGTLVPVSNKLLKDSAALRSVEDVIRGDIVEAMALKLDEALLAGSGVNPIPLGISGQAGKTPPPPFGANGRAPTYDDLIDVTQASMGVNAPFARPGWAFHPRTLGTLRKIKTGVAGSVEYLADAGLLTFDAQGASGSLLGYPWRATTAIPATLEVGTSTDASRIYWSSDWNEAWIGEGVDEAGAEEFDIEVSSEASYTPDGGATWVSAFQNNQSLFRAIGHRDIGLRRPALFTVVEGVRP